MTFYAGARTHTHTLAYINIAYCNIVIQCYLYKCYTHTHITPDWSNNSWHAKQRKTSTSYVQGFGPACWPSPLSALMSCISSSLSVWTLAVHDSKGTLWALSLRFGLKEHERQLSSWGYQIIGRLTWTLQNLSTCLVCIVHARSGRLAMLIKHFCFWPVLKPMLVFTLAVRAKEAAQELRGIFWFHPQCGWLHCYLGPSFSLSASAESVWPNVIASETILHVLLLFMWNATCVHIAFH